MTRSTRYFAVALLFLIALVTGCDTLEPDGISRRTKDYVGIEPPDRGPVIKNPTIDPSVVRMAEYIEETLSHAAVGFAYVVNEDGQLAASGAEGWARKPGEGNLPMKTTTRMNVASVTKTVTAVATLKLLEALDLSVDEPISPWLPAEWVQGQGFAGASGVTFRQLMNHTSGLNQAFNAMSKLDQKNWKNNWKGLEFIVANGTTPNSPAQYKNANYALLRVIIPALWKATGTDPGIPYINSISAGVWYVAYIQNEIFKPIGVNAVVCQPQPGFDEALGYNVTDATKPGAMSSTALADCGGHAGLHLSARDLANFMANVRYNDAILSPANRLLMDTGKLGWRGGSNGSGIAAGKYWHDGFWKLGSGRELHACVMKYPNNLEATLVINSSQTSGQSTCRILQNAYQEAV